jgi:hypothetical protein
MSELSIEVSRSRRARLWLDALPDAKIQSDGVISRSYSAVAHRASPPHEVAIEFVTPTGPRAIYGLLGAQFTETAGTELLLDVAFGGPGVQFRSPLSYAFDVPRVGLPRDYSIAALAGVEAAFDERTPTPGRLSICCAAHSDGSSEALFHRLGFWLALVVFDARARTDDAFRQLLAGPLWNAPPSAGRKA